MNIPAKPKALSVILTNIPQQLRDLEQWVLWKYEQRDGRWTKVPYSSRGQRAKSNDPTSWSDFRTVEREYKKGGYDGIGIVLAEGDGLAGVDLDKCMTSTGLNSAADEIWSRFESTYTERSPSGTGLRIFGYGRPARCGKGGDGNWIEVYDHSSPRYLTVTGHKIGGARISQCQDALNWLHERYMHKPETKPALQPKNVSLDDQAILDMARSASNGSLFRALYDQGDISQCGGDHSSADLALCNMLAFWCGGDPTRMESMFAGSALYREKWAKRSDYRQRTIQKAIADAKEFYSPTKHASSPSISAPVQDFSDVDLAFAQSELSHDSRNFRATFAQSESPKAEQEQTPKPDFSNFRANRALFFLAGAEVDQLPILPERPTPSKFPQTPYDQLFAAIQDRTQAPYVMCAQAALAAMTLAVQHLADIEVPGIGGGSARRPISNFFISIAESGERKSSVDRIVMEGVDKATIRLESSHRDMMMRYKQRMWEYDAQMRNAKSRKDSSYDDVGEPPEPPREPHFVVKEPTADGIFHSLMVGQFSQGLYNDEGGAFLGGYGMSEDQRMRTAASFNKLWDGGKLDKPRSKTYEVVRDRRFSVHLMLQPKASDQLVGDAMLADLGFTARCLIAEPESQIGSRPFREPHPDSIALCDQFAKVVQDCIEWPCLPNERGDGLNPRVLQLNPEAKAVWVAFHDEVESDLRGKYAVIKQFANKAPEHAIRLAAVIHLFADKHVQVISAHGIALAIEMMRFYLSEHLRMATGRGTEKDEEAAMLVSWIEKKWDGGDIISLADICRSGPPKIRKRDIAQRAIEVAVQTGHLKLLPGEHEVKGERRKQCFKILRESAKPNATS